MATDTTATPEQEVTWGDALDWGQTLVWGGPRGVPDIVSPTAICHLLVTADYVNDPSIRVWTGQGELELGGVTYTGIGTEVISVRIGQATEKEDARLQVTLAGLTDTETRMAFYEFRGRVVVTVTLVYSNDGGETWLPLPRRFTGLYSRPQIENDTVSFEVATYREELDRGYELEWSDENQRRDFPGDAFFAHLEVISDGVNLSWPP